MTESGSLPELATAIRHADTRHGLFAAGDTVVVGVSGGPDSVGLLSALLAYAPERALRLHVAHLNHTLRRDAAEDAGHVVDLARRLGLPATVVARDVAAAATHLGRGVEDAARTVRYAFLAAVAAAVGAPVVAVAHTADDQAETVLLNLLRGTGLDGLRGMLPRSVFPLAPAEIDALEAVTRPVAVGWPPSLVRPLLGIRRAEVRAGLDGSGLPARDDPSNRDPRWRRNRLRQTVIPALEALNPRIVEALARLAAAAGDDLAVVEAVVDGAWARLLANENPAEIALWLEGWAGETAAVQRRLIRRAVTRLRGDARDLAWDHVEAARRVAEGPSGGAVTLPGRLDVRRDGDRLVVRRPRRAPAGRCRARPVRR